MVKKFSTLRQKMGSEARLRAKRKAAAMLYEMFLDEPSKERGSPE
jgi:hypothetical protein